MFEIKPESNFSTIEKLLYNIWEELTKLNSAKEEIIPENNAKNIKRKGDFK